MIICKPNLISVTFLLGTTSKVKVVCDNMFAFELSFNVAMYYKINQWFAIRKANVENTCISHT